MRAWNYCCFLSLVTASEEASNTPFNIPPRVVELNCFLLLSSVQGLRRIATFIHHLPCHFLTANSGGRVLTSCCVPNFFFSSPSTARYATPFLWVWSHGNYCLSAWPVAVERSPPARMRKKDSTARRQARLEAWNSEWEAHMKVDQAPVNITYCIGPT